MKSPLEQFDIINVKTLNFLSVDLSLNNIMIPLIFLIFLLISIIWCFNKQLNIVSNYYQNFLESIFNIIISIIKQQAHIYGLVWFPFIFSIFNFILFCNLLSLIPFGIAITSHFIIIFLLSSTIVTSIFSIGLLRFNLKFLHIFIPQSPFLLLLLLIPIEIFSYLIRLFSLAIRLAANILAGHTLVHIIVSFIFNILKTDFILSIIFLIPLFLILILEFGVAFLQAYIFTVLICIYLSDTEKLGSH